MTRPIGKGGAARLSTVCNAHAAGTLSAYVLHDKKRAVPLDRDARHSDQANEQSYDEDAVSRLYRAESPRLLRLFKPRVAPQDAGDLVHDCFVAIANTLQRNAERVEKPEAYLTRIAQNFMARSSRTASRRSSSLHLNADDLPLTTGDPHIQLEARDLLTRLETAMLRLRPLTRQIFIARRISGYSYQEIAERTGVSTKRIEKHMAKAIAELDHVLSER